MPPSNPPLIEVPAPTHPPAVSANGSGEASLVALITTANQILERDFIAALQGKEESGPHPSLVRLAGEFPHGLFRQFGRSISGTAPGPGKDA